MARVDSASLMPIIPGLEDRIGNCLGWLTLSDFPKGDGSTLRIAGYELPFHYIHVSPSTPGDVRPHVALDISSLDVPARAARGRDHRVRLMPSVCESHTQSPPRPSCLVRPFTAPIKPYRAHQTRVAHAHNVDADPHIVDVEEN